MNISDNIKWIMNEEVNWVIVKNKSYMAKIQKADSNRVYNVADTKGVVYNILEDSYEKVGDNGYVVTGIAGEMWPIGENALKKYQTGNKEITFNPIPVMTIELDTVYAAVQIPLDVQFTVEVDYGEKALLNGNRNGIGHGGGDYVLVFAKKANGKYVPDFDDCGRIINGEIFEKIYRTVE